MRLRRDCGIISFRGKHLLTTGVNAMEVNESFAETWALASKGSFTEESLAAELVGTYGLDPEDAARETAGLIETWKSHNLLDEND